MYFKLFVAGIKKAVLFFLYVELIHSNLAKLFINTNNFYNEEIGSEILINLSQIIHLISVYLSVKK